MKNDLEQLKIDTSDFKVEEEFNVTKLGKIRNSVYFIVSRAIKFGLSLDYLLTECDLINKLIKDLGL